MTNSHTKKINIFNILYISGILFLIFLLVLTPQSAIKSFGQGVLIWGTKILPSLLPFFILTKLLSYTKFTNTIGGFISPITKKLYGVGGISGYIYIMSILSGYPIGAKLTADLYKTKKITTKQAHTISSFTSTSGPLFIIGTVGVGFFNNHEMGVIILISHLIGSLINGLLYKNKDNQHINYTFKTHTTNNFLQDTMTSSISSIMVVGGFVALFYMILSLLIELNVFSPFAILLEKIGISSNITTATLSGMIEVTTGELLLSQCVITPKLSTTISTFLISFGGLSIHAQAFCYLKEFNMPYFKFFIMKTSHAVISATLSFLILLVI